MSELQTVKKQLENLKQVHTDLAKEYGSELCAEEMIKKEEKLRKRIKELKDDKKDSNH